MASMSININLQMLKAVAIAASKDTTRRYLCGVCVEVTHSRVTYVATDGHILAAMSHERNDVSDADTTVYAKWIIPSEAIANIKVGKNTSDWDKFAALSNDGNGLRIDRVGDLLAAFKPIDGTYPDWRLVVPRSESAGASPCSGVLAQFDPAIMTKCASIYKAAGFAGIMAVVHNGDKPALCSARGPSNLVVVIMPFRAHDLTGYRLPDWI